ncbi:hypothetical protein PGTUg99_020316 [Puccinia graminis f. sp. tritici]|uniref:Uncharacterized protein n=1 Tax=Puccinia graminis f. sp. tritici TaxID=56615 RepID=A0A5B0REW4_PUCGR|nr:hypothetical protein PGTUg99_020316 [Puccinia graminis f. sp. tritici]
MSCDIHHVFLSSYTGVNHAEKDPFFLILFNTVTSSSSQQYQANHISTPSYLLH